MTVDQQNNVHSSARIGGAPEDRTWELGDLHYFPAIAPSAHINAYVTVDAGTERATTIGERTWLLKHSHVGHDALVGADCDIATGAVIGGWAEIGDRVKVGLNATVLPYRTIGDGARVGAGAVVTRDVPAGVTVAGNPARPLDPNPVPYTAR